MQHSACYIVLGICDVDIVCVGINSDAVRYFDACICTVGNKLVGNNLLGAYIYDAVSYGIAFCPIAPCNAVVIKRVAYYNHVGTWYLVDCIGYDHIGYGSTFML